MAHGSDANLDEPKASIRRFVSGISAAVIVVLGTACSSTNRSDAPEPARDLHQILGDATMRVCSTGDYRPFTYRDPQGSWSGLDIDMADQLASSLGVKVDLVPTTWGAMMKDLGAKCDMAMGGITVTSDRAKHALYSAPYLHDGKAAIVRCADSSKYRTLADIDQAGVRVVVNPGGTNADFDEANIHRATIIRYPDNNTIFEQIANHDADAMITDGSEIRWQTMQNPQLCGVSTDHPFTSEQKAYLIPQTDPDLQQRVDQWLRTVQDDGTYSAISQKWLGQVMGP
jgi:cyclohexadienyl dehydratase